MNQQLPLSKRASFARTASATIGATLFPAAAAPTGGKMDKPATSRMMRSIAMRRRLRLAFFIALITAFVYNVLRPSTPDFDDSGSDEGFGHDEGFLSTLANAVRLRQRPYKIIVHIPAPRAGSHEIDDKQPPVAVCIAGQMRSFHLFSVRQSILYHVLQPLRDAGHHVHTFFHISDNDLSHSSMAPVVEHHADSMLTPFAPASLTTFPVTRGCPVKACKLPRDTGCPHTLLRADECMRVVERHERQHNFTFGWIYRTRPDIAFASNMSIPPPSFSDSIDADERTTVYTNMHSPHTSMYSHAWLRETFPQHAGLLRAAVGDLVAIVPRHMARLVFTASRAFADCALFRMSANGTITPEVSLTYWFVRHGVRYRPTPWLWMLVREYSGPECSNMPFIEQVNRSMDDAARGICASYKRTGVLPPLSV